MAVRMVSLPYFFLQGTMHFNIQTKYNKCIQEFLRFNKRECKILTLSNLNACDHFKASKAYSSVQFK